MSLICAISNEVPEHPVLSPVSGHIYERRLAEKFINESGTDPMSGESLTIEQLIDVKAPPLVKPKPPSATSIPAILKSLQDEWDAVMLHSFTLRQQLQTARQELSHTLYQHDAACRVIARLTKEVTAAREALATLKPQAGVLNPAGGPTAVPVAQPPPPGTTPSVEDMTAVNQLAEVVGMSDEVIVRLQETATRLTAERKKRGKQPPEGLVSSEEMRNLHQKASHVGLHSASVPGILCLDACQHDSNKVITGGNDKNAVVFNKETEQIVAVLRGHNKKVTSVVYHPREELAFTGSPDATIRVWGVQKAACAFVLRAHEAAVTGLSLHATGDYLLSASADAHWALSDIRVGRVLLKVADQQKTQALTCAQFHPDGLILGTGTEEAEVKIWDLKDRNNVANFSSHEGPITAMHFSENGYYLATAATDGVVKLWDLRKLKNFKTIIPSDDRRYEIKEVCFDQSGSYLAIAGSDVRVYLCKQWSELSVINDHTAMCTGVRFGSMARSLISCSMDRSVKVFSV